MSKQEFDYLKTGVPLPLEFMGSLQPGWIPGSFGDNMHPLDGMYGAYLPSCTADIGIGRVDARYSNRTWFHHGGISIRKILSALGDLIPDPEAVYLYGGSGGGVASAAWMSPVADSFPNAQVYCLVDSGFHMMPGTDIFKFFYNNVPWSHGPGEQLAAKVYTDYKVPSFDWLDIRSIATQLNGYGGRVKIAYIGCDNDHIVYSDRQLMGKYVTIYNDELYSKHQVDEMWHFLTTTHACAPPGTVSSWVASCTHHHLTLKMGLEMTKMEKGDIKTTKYQSVQVKDGISVKDFIYNFLRGEPLDKDHPDRRHFWYDNRTTQMANALGNCSSGSMMAAGSASRNDLMSSRTVFCFTMLLWLMQLGC